MSKRTLWAVATVAVLAALPLACKKQQDTPNQFQGGVGMGTGTDPYATGTTYGSPGNTGYGTPGNTGYGTPGTAPTATSTAPQPTATATGQGDIVGMVGGMVGGLLGGLGGGVPGADPLSTGVQYNAQANAPGMRADGQPVKLQLSQGQTAEGQVTLQPGKCYTLVGASMPGVLDVAVQATFPAPMQQQVLGQNEGTGPMPVVWPKEKCYRSSLPMAAPIRIAITMRSGSGMVAIQPYSK